MKKKLAVLLAFLLCFSVGLSACGTKISAKVGEVPSSSYAVIGNGGMSVQQGEYIYFINGYAEAADEGGNTNRDDSVIRGGVYRVKLADVGESKIRTVTSTADAAEYGDETKFADPYLGYYGTYTTVEPADATPVQNSDASDTSGFVMNVVKDYEDKEIAQVKVEPIVNKKVTTGGDANGGLFIFDGWLYFTTPVNRKNSDGEVQYNLVDFMRVRLDGSNMQTVYTSNSTSTKPTYGYYRYEDVTYLVVYDVSASDGTTQDVLYGIPCGGKKVGKRFTVATDVASAMFAKKPVYYRGMPEDGVEDFVYFTRTPTQSDVVASGNIVCRIRPDGSQGAEIMSNDMTVTLLDAKNGLLFYTEKNKIGDTHLKASDLLGSALDADDEDTRPVLRTTVYDLFGKAGDLTNIYVNAEIQACMSVENPNGTSRKVSATPYAIATYNSNTVKVTNVSAEATTLLSGTSAIVQTMYGNSEFLYVTGADGGVPVYKANIVEQNQTGVKLTQQNAVIKDFFAVDVSAGYLFYVSDKVTVVTESTEEEDEDADQTPVDPDKDEEKTYVTIGNYVLVRRVSDYTSEPEWLAAAIDSKDIPEKNSSDSENTES